MFDVQSELAPRIVRVRITGVVWPDEMRRFATAYRDATTQFGGGRHFVVADMRGLKALDPESEQILAEVISWARRRGVVVCAHVTDLPISTVQTSRLVSRSPEDDAITVEVGSVEEADALIAARRALLSGASNGGQAA